MVYLTVHNLALASLQIPTLATCTSAPSCALATLVHISKHILTLGSSCCPSAQVLSPDSCSTSILTLFTSDQKSSPTSLSNTVRPLIIPFDGLYSPLDISYMRASSLLLILTADPTFRKDLAHSRLSINKLNE